MAFLRAHDRATSAAHKHPSAPTLLFLPSAVYHSHNHDPHPLVRQLMARMPRCHLYRISASRPRSHNGLDQLGFPVHTRMRARRPFFNRLLSHLAKSIYLRLQSHSFLHRISTRSVEVLSVDLRLLPSTRHPHWTTYAENLSSSSWKTMVTQQLLMWRIVRLVNRYSLKH